MSALRDEAAIVGVGHSPCRKDLGKPPLEFSIDTCLQAIDDAGLAVEDIDGLCAMGGQDEPSTLQMMEALGLPGVNYYGGALGGGVGPSVVAQAALAVAGGVCETALAWRTMTAPRPNADTTYNYMGFQGGRGVGAFTLPYGLGVFMQYFAPWYQRRRKIDGVTDEQMGAYVVAMRDNVSRNPHAVLNQPITMDEYVASRYVAEPLRLFDCDMPVDVCGAVVITTAERAKDLRHSPVFVSAVTTGTGPKADMIFWHDYDESAYAWSAKRLWKNAGLGPDDMDFAMMYDGFAPLVLYGLEEYGLVAKGEAGSFLGDGGHLRTGRLPVNPHGGNNSEGRSHAIGHVVEAALQLQGRLPGERQLPDVHATVINGGAITLSGAMVLHN